MTIGGSPLQACTTWRESSDDNRRQSFTGLHNLAMSLAQNGGSLKPGKEECERRSVTPAAKTMICGDHAEAHATGDSQTGRPLSE